jgi:hypothetical protein
MDDHVHDSGVEKLIVPLHTWTFALDDDIGVWGGHVGFEDVCLDAKKLSPWLPVGGYSRLVASRLRFAALNLSKEWTRGGRSL